ncbi:hypothetical protein F4779DRAFT_567915 [Xylariaceae sp. FL0662B]|nr:hypothetical protein F4779DRAFT_567915 [Xylariaceae sp. FL0662B]
MNFARDSDDPVVSYVSPYKELNAGLWTLFVAATLFLGLRFGCKIAQGHRLWYDDHILIASWIVFLVNNSLIVHEFATGYILKDSTEKWDDRMHILINISSCFMLVGQAWTKSAFGVTLLRISNQWQQWVLWFCIATMNLYMVIKVIFQWAKVCGEKSYDNWYRLDFCIDPTFRDDFKEGGNVYNIIMDFVFAAFPWWITRSLDMRRVERIGLCVTMSLGMLVAIESAVRVSWKDDGNKRDAYYIWRNGMSQIWYTSEIAGTMIVQCVPILRPILREVHKSYISKKLGYTTGSRSTIFGGSRLSTTFANRLSARAKRQSAGANRDPDKRDIDTIALKEIPVEPENSWMNLYSPSSAVDIERGWKPSGSRGSLRCAFEARKSLDYEADEASYPSTNADVDQYVQHGLSPPPPRR